VRCCSFLYQSKREQEHYGHVRWLISLTRPIALGDHLSALAGIRLTDLVLGEVQAAFDRARNTIIYAFFDYDLVVVGELQAFGAFELALKHRLNGRGSAFRGTLRNLVDRARKAGILPLHTPSANVSTDSIEALIVLRNELSHGASDIHSPGMALQVIDACAFWINHVCSPQSGWTTKFEYFVSFPGTLTSCGRTHGRSSAPDKPSRQSLDDLHDHLPILAGNPVE